jgi:hypothetical protein
MKTLRGVYGTKKKKKKKKEKEKKERYLHDMQASSGRQDPDPRFHHAVQVQEKSINAIFKTLVALNGSRSFAPHPWQVVTES